MSSFLTRPHIVLILAFVLTITFFHELQRSFKFQYSVHLLESDADCTPLSGLQDILVVLKTGATEAREKVPTHFETTLRCIPNYVVYSDLEEVLAGQQVFDVLAGVDDNIKKHNPDFKIYNRLKKGGRSSLGTAELEKWSSVPNTAAGSLENPAWTLDKWKFLPLIDRALSHSPQAKWYVFMEADTHISWRGLVEWLSHFDSREPYYLGSQAQIADVVFAHGGSGFIVSNSAMKMASSHRARNLAHYDDYTARHWAGDCVLGKLMADVGIELTWSWPNLQGSFATLDHNATAYDKKAWCYGAVSHHHMAPGRIREFHEFEQRWNAENPVALRHGDVFEHFFMPRILEDRDGWDNTSEEPVSDKSIGSFEDCRAACKDRKDCMQFSYSDRGCFASANIRLGNCCRGEACGNIKSGWLNDRVETFAQQSDQCGDPKWVMS